MILFRILPKNSEWKGGLIYNYDRNNRVKWVLGPRHVEERGWPIVIHNSKYRVGGSGRILVYSSNYGDEWCSVEKREGGK